MQSSQDTLGSTTSSLESMSRVLGLFVEVRLSSSEHWMKPEEITSENAIFCSDDLESNVYELAIAVNFWNDREFVITKCSVFSRLGKWLQDPGTKASKDPTIICAFLFFRLATWLPGQNKSE